MAKRSTDTGARLLITCPDKPGIVATVTGFLFEHGVNITHCDQHATAPEGGTFFMRVEFDTAHMDLPAQDLETVFGTRVAKRFGMDYRFSYAARPKKMVVMVSKQDHAMMELLWRWQRGELPAELTMVVSNHMKAGPAVGQFQLPFHHVPISKTTKPQAEAQLLRLLEGKADLIVLARYMQILSPELVARYPGRIINIHHSFLPAFVGAKPYHRAAERGVKLIGATAHYVTADLDAGPIIDQDVIRVSHRHGVKDLIAFGRDIERQVLARAVKWHLEDRVLIHDNKTVVFA